MMQPLLKSPFVKALIPVLAALMVQGCGAGSLFTPGLGKKYEYAYTMVAPASERDMVYQDETLVIQFRFDEAAVRFQLQNVAEGEMNVDWPKAAIGIDGRFSTVRHSANLYSDSTAFSPIIIPSMGYIRDIVIPVENIFYDGSKWVERDLLPTVDRGSARLRTEILRSQGKQVSVILPLIVNGEERIYEFAFAVSSVREISWREYRPVHRVPEPPKMTQTGGSQNQLTFALVTFGILSFIAFVITQTKNPPTE